MATNAAMVLAKEVGQQPRAVADALKAELEKLPHITLVEVAGPGFINLRLKADAFSKIIPHILNTGTKFGVSDAGKGAKVNIEYVSANPTGPLTVGHARGAIYGDALSNLMVKAGYQVNREYYVNDAGKQVEVLTDSVILRIREQLGESITIPEGCYPGEYLKDVAAGYVADKGKDFSDRRAVRDYAIEFLMNEIKSDLHDLGIHHDVFVSEDAILASGAVQKAMDQLTHLGLIYEGVLEAPKGKQPDDWEPREQTLFRSSDFGDDTDRALKKSDGSTTYFANDIAHFFHVAQQGYPTLILVVGADHGGYVKRAKSAVKAITEGKAELFLPLMAIVHVTENGQPVKMSKRAGTFITLRDMIDRVGAGVMRFIMLTREAGQTLEFDYAKVTEQSKDNPYFYVQYVHARAYSVLKQAREMFAETEVSDAALAKVDLSLATSPEEQAMIKLLATWPRVVEQAASAQEPHRIAYFAQDVAAAFHGWWNRGRDDGSLRFLLADNKDLSLARLAIVRAMAVTLAAALGVIGVEPLNELRSDLEEAA
jgi:arginyl-tRNA synthetase